MFCIVVLSFLPWSQAYAYAYNPWCLQCWLVNSSLGLACAYACDIDMEDIWADQLCQADMDWCNCTYDGEGLVQGMVKPHASHTFWVLCTWSKLFWECWCCGCSWWLWCSENMKKKTDHNTWSKLVMGMFEQHKLYLNMGLLCINMGLLYVNMGLLYLNMGLLYV